MRLSILSLSLALATSAAAQGRFELNATGMSRIQTFFPTTGDVRRIDYLLVGAGLAGAYLHRLGDANFLGPVLTLQAVDDTEYLGLRGRLPRLEGYAGVAYERLLVETERFRFLLGATAAWAVSGVMISDYGPTSGPMGRARAVVDYRLGKGAALSLAPEIAALFQFGRPVVWQPMVSLGVAFH